MCCSNRVMFNCRLTETDVHRHLLQERILVGTYAVDIKVLVCYNQYILCSGVSASKLLTSSFRHSMYVLQRKKRMKFDCCFIGKGENDSDTESIPNTSMISYM